MAKLSANGQELLRWEALDGRFSLRSNGHILLNRGGGWKQWKRLKKEVSPEQFAERRKAKIEALQAERPFYCLYRDLLCDAVALEQRARLHTYIELMPGDPDGVWSEMNDYGNDHITVEEAVKLCEAYSLHKRESDRIRKEKQEAIQPSMF